MRTAALTLVFFFAFSAAKSQRFTLLPQAGVEISKTKISYNDVPSFAPLGSEFAPSVSLRLNYASKQGHGFFLGAATSRSSVLYGFVDPEKGMDSYTVSAGNMQVRLEGGYQFSSKPIYFNKSKQVSAKTQAVQTVEKKRTCAFRSLCPKAYNSSGCARKSIESKQPVQSSNKGAWMKIQPSAGIGFIPGVGDDMMTKTTYGHQVYEYRAGNWNTAFITGAGFEFGKNETRLFTVSVNYFKGIGNLNTQTLITESASKTVTTSLQSASSGWNFRIGIPLTLGAKNSTAKSATVNAVEQPKKQCGKYKSQYQCGRRM